MAIRLDAKNISSRTNQQRKEKKKGNETGIKSVQKWEELFIRAYIIGEWDSGGGAPVTRGRASGAEDSGDGTPRQSVHRSFTGGRN